MQDPDELLILAEIQAKKQFGQNFLTDDRYAKLLVDTAQLTNEDRVIEIGPGIGTVSKYILATGAKLTAIEIDKDMIEYMQERFGADKNLTILNQDILKIAAGNIVGKNKEYKVISSLPYYASKAIIKNFLESEHKPLSISVIIQKEVGEDYAAKPPKGTFLGNYSQGYADVDFVEIVPKVVFSPEPKVDGAIINFNLKGKIEPDIKDFNRFLKGIFLNKRKTLLNNLSSMLHKDKNDIERLMTEMGININARVQELNRDQIYKLFKLAAQ